MSAVLELVGSTDVGDGEPNVWHLCLYVAGQSPKSLQALANLKHLCERYLAGRHRIEVVDLVLDPTLAQRDDILAVPTLVRRSPEPQKKLIGDLSDLDRSVAALGLLHASGR
jgi:circadian clock protein KaiB